MTDKLRYHKTAERPDSKLWLLGDDGNLIDFSSGYTFSFKIGRRGTAAVLTKTTGITGAAGSGGEPTGTPNVTIVYSAGEFAAVTPSPSYRWQLTATVGGLDRVFEGAFELVEVIL
jgi:hypothetical protein